MHWPVSLLTTAPGRTPGHAPVPAGAAAGTGISLQGLPPRVQFAFLPALAGAAAIRSNRGDDGDDHRDSQTHSVSSWG